MKSKPKVPLSNTNTDVYSHRFNNYLSGSPQKLFIETIPKVKIEFPESSNTLLVSPYSSKEHIGPMLKTRLWDADSNYDLETYDGAKIAFRSIGQIEHIDIYGAVECVRDPRPLIKEIRKLLIKHDIRARIYYSNKIIESKACFRTYARKELETLFESAGFGIVSKSNEYFVIQCDKKLFREFLNSHNMPDFNLKYLFITTEHPDYRITGGIGSYIKEASDYYGNQANILIVDDNINYNGDMVEKNGWFSLQNILGKDGFDYYQKNDHGATGDAITEALLSLLLFYDLQSIEGADYGGMTLFRQIQAKKAGILPMSIKLITVCHGSSLYTANGAGGVVAPHALSLFYRETYSIIESDYTVFLTKFMEDLYNKHGIYAKNPIYERLPFNYELVPFKNNKFSECKNIIYIGKPTKTKGFDIFLKTLLELSKIHHKEINIKCFTTFTDIPEPEVKLLYNKVSAIYNTELVSLKRRDLLEELALRSTDSLAIVSYPADNHPNVILELTASGMDFIATNSGGIPELIVDGFSENFLVENDPERIAKKVKIAINNRKIRQSDFISHRKKYISVQEDINNNYKKGRLLNLKKINGIETIDLNETVDVIVPCYNTEISQLKTALESLKNQSILPNKTYIINDGSTAKNYLNDIKKLLQDFKIINPEIINKPNGGLADARNTGLKKSKSRYVATLDSDDIVSNFYIEDMLRALIMNPQAIGATPYLSDFKDQTVDPQKFNPDAYEYHPTGNFVSMSFLPSNFYGSAAGIFRRERLIQLTGGWDSLDKSMWEDWALYIKLKCLDEEVLIVPRILYFYRVRADSMVRTYSKKDGVNRLLRNYEIMPKLDAYVLYAQQKYVDNIQQGIYPPEIWDPITAHAHSEALALRKFEKKYHIDKLKRVYHKGKRSGSVLKNTLSRKYKND
jgi:glycosyltransferase involved in cell wall biosynthesis